MPESLSPDHLKLRADAHEFAREVLLTSDEEDVVNARGRVREAAKTAGFFAMTQPRQFGGSEATQTALTVVREVLASHNAPLIDAVFGPSPGVLANVEEPLRSTHLAPLLAGEKRSAFGFTEPDDVDRPTWGVLEDDTLTITGQKSYVTGGADADFINTLVNIEDRGPSMVVIDHQQPGGVGDHHRRGTVTDLRRVGAHRRLREGGQGDAAGRGPHDHLARAEGRRRGDLRG